MRGPKPKPTAQRALEGNPGKRALNELEPTPPPVTESFDEPPKFFAALPAAEAEWRRLAPMLRKCRQVTEADRSALIALCMEWHRYLEASQHAYPHVIKAPSGYPVLNPWLSVQTKALSACLKLWPELGLTPSSRSRVMAEGPGPGGDAFSEFDQVPPLQPMPQTEH